MYDDIDTMTMQELKDEVLGKRAYVELLEMEQEKKIADGVKAQIDTAVFDARSTAFRQGRDSAVGDGSDLAETVVKKMRVALAEMIAETSKTHDEAMMHHEVWNTHDAITVTDVSKRDPSSLVMKTYDVDLKPRRMTFQFPIINRSY